MRAERQSAIDEQHDVEPEHDEGGLPDPPAHSRIPQLRRYGPIQWVAVGTQIGHSAHR